MPCRPAARPGALLQSYERRSRWPLSSMGCEGKLGLSHGAPGTLSFPTPKREHRERCSPECLQVFTRDAYNLLRGRTAIASRCPRMLLSSGKVSLSFLMHLNAFLAELTRAADFCDSDEVSVKPRGTLHPPVGTGTFPPPSRVGPSAPRHLYPPELCLVTRARDYGHHPSL